MGYTSMGTEIEWTPEHAAEYVSEPWRRGVESFIQTGQRLIEAKARVGHGNWLPTLDLLPFDHTVAKRLMQVAGNPAISNSAHAHYLPRDYTTLATLASLPEGQITQAIQSGDITPKTTRKQASELVKKSKNTSADIEAEPDARKITGDEAEDDLRYARQQWINVGEAADAVRSRPTGNLETSEKRRIARQLRAALIVMEETWS